MKFKIKFFLIIGSFFCVVNTQAQTVVNMPNVNERPSMQANQLATEPVIDGEVLQDELWKSLTPADQM